MPRGLVSPVWVILDGFNMALRCPVIPRKRKSGLLALMSTRPSLETPREDPDITFSFSMRVRAGSVRSVLAQQIGSPRRRKEPTLRLNSTECFGAIVRERQVRNSLNVNGDGHARRLDCRTGLACLRWFV
jgi:hypothetical protein